MKRFLLIANPRAGRNRGELAAREVVDQLAQSGHSAEIRLTERGGHATDIAASARNADFDYVVAIGGDGTVREVLWGLLDRGQHTEASHPVGLIPFGTANVIARELGVPLNDARAAAKLLCAPEPVAIDYGFCNSEVMIANAGIGFDAMVVHELARRRASKTRISMLSYIPIGIGIFLNYSAPKLIVEIDGEPIPGEFNFATLCNFRNYGGLLAPCPDARADDGQFDICLRRGRSVFAILAHHLCSITGIRGSKRSCLYRRGRHFVIRMADTGGTPGLAQVDGEAFGQAPLEIKVGQGSIEFLGRPRKA